MPQAGSIHPNVSTPWAQPSRAEESTGAHEPVASTAIASTKPRVARVLIVDDQTLFRSGLAKLLAEDPRVEVVGQGVDGLDALKQVAVLKPDVVMMDIKMPNLDGIEATRRIVAEHPGVRILVLTSFDADSFVLQALRAGASGYVLKDSQPEAIVSSVLSVLSGERVMTSTVANRVLDMLTGSTTSKEFYDGLTERELEILKLMATGQANKQIARRLAISEKTVRNHVSHMYEKLQIYDRSQAVLYAVRKGLVEL
jgi:DNA-binding NarL/FixJ family response regulator